MLFLFKIILYCMSIFMIVENEVYQFQHGIHNKNYIQ